MPILLPIHINVRTSSGVSNIPRPGITPTDMSQCFSVSPPPSLQIWKYLIGVPNNVTITHKLLNHTLNYDVIVEISAPEYLTLNMPSSFILTKNSQIDLIISLNINKLDQLLRAGTVFGKDVFQIEASLHNPSEPVILPGFELGDADTSNIQIAVAN